MKCLKIQKKSWPNNCSIVKILILYFTVSWIFLLYLSLILLFSLLSFLSLSVMFFSIKQHATLCHHLAMGGLTLRPLWSNHLCWDRLRPTPCTHKYIAVDWSENIILIILIILRIINGGKGLNTIYVHPHSIN